MSVVENLAVYNNAHPHDDNIEDSENNGISVFQRKSSTNDLLDLGDETDNNKNNKGGFSRTSSSSNFAKLASSVSNGAYTVSNNAVSTVNSATKGAVSTVNSATKGVIKMGIKTPIKFAKKFGDALGSSNHGSSSKTKMRDAMALPDIELDGDDAPPKSPQRQPSNSSLEDFAYDNDIDDEDGKDNTRPDAVLRGSARAKSRDAMRQRNRSTTRVPRRQSSSGLGTSPTGGAEAGFATRARRSRRASTAGLATSTTSATGTTTADQSNGEEIAKGSGHSKSRRRGGSVKPLKRGVGSEGNLPGLRGSVNGSKQEDITTNNNKQDASVSNRSKSKRTEKGGGEQQQRGRKSVKRSSSGYSERGESVDARNSRRGRSKSIKRGGAKGSSGNNRARSSSRGRAASLSRAKAGKAGGDAAAGAADPKTPEVRKPSFASLAIMNAMKAKEEQENQQQQPTNTENDVPSTPRTTKTPQVPKTPKTTGSISNNNNNNNNKRFSISRSGSARDMLAKAAAALPNNTPVQTKRKSTSGLKVDSTSSGTDATLDCTSEDWSEDDLLFRPFGGGSNDTINDENDSAAKNKKDETSAASFSVKSSTSSTASGSVSKRQISTTITKSSYPRETYYEIAQEMKEVIEIKDRVYHLRTYKQCFLGIDAVSFIKQYLELDSREEALQVGREMNKEIGCFEHVVKEHRLKDKKLFYVFTESGRSTKSQSTTTPGNRDAPNNDDDEDDDDHTEADEIDDSEGEDAPAMVAIDPKLLARAREAEKRLAREKHIQGGKNSTHSISSLTSATSSAHTMSARSHTSSSSRLLSTADPSPPTTINSGPQEVDTNKKSIPPKQNSKKRNKRPSTSSRRNSASGRKALFDTINTTPAADDDDEIEDEGGWTCPCGEDNKEAFNFCGLCGGKRICEEPTHWECAACGRGDNEQRFRFCVGCGQQR